MFKEAHTVPIEVRGKGNVSRELITIEVIESDRYSALNVGETYDVMEGTSPKMYYFQGGVVHQWIYKVHCKVLGRYIEKSTKVFFKRIGNYHLFRDMIGADTRTFKSTKSFNTRADDGIEITTSGEFIHRGNKLKLGKILRAIYPDMTDEDIENYVSKWKSMFNVDTSKVLVGSDIGNIYDMEKVGDSCMAGQGEKMAVYETLDQEIAYILDDKGKLLARAILWNNLRDRNTKEVLANKFLDRVFTDNKIYELTLLKWAEENNILDLTKEGRDLRTIKDFGYLDDEAPYVDTMYHCIRVKGDSSRWYLSNSRVYSCDDLQNTDGGSGNGVVAQEDREDYVYCEDTGNDVHVDDVYWVESEQCYYEYDDDLIYINDYGHVSIENNSDWCQFDDTGEYGWKEDGYYIEDLDVWFETDDEIYEDRYGEYWSTVDEYIDYLEKRIDDA